MCEICEEKSYVKFLTIKYVKFVERKSHRKFHTTCFSLKFHSGKLHKILHDFLQLRNFTKIKYKRHNVRERAKEREKERVIDNHWYIELDRENGRKISVIEADSSRSSIRPFHQKFII